VTVVAEGALSETWMGIFTVPESPSITELLDNEIDGDGGGDVSLSTIVTVALGRPKTAANGALNVTWNVSSPSTSVSGRIRILIAFEVVPAAITSCLLTTAE
jgi:hypothetical protein